MLFNLTDEFLLLTNNGKIVINIKCFTLNYENSLKLNKESMREIINKKQTTIQLNCNLTPTNKVRKDLVINK